MKATKRITDKELEKGLKEGKSFIFDNEEFQNEIQGDDLRHAEILFRRPEEGFSYPGEFHILFNGKLIHTSKTFKSLSRRLDKLKLDLNLKLTEIN